MNGLWGSWGKLGYFFSVEALEDVGFLRASFLNKVYASLADVWSKSWLLFENAIKGENHLKKYTFSLSSILVQTAVHTM
jgi:hypothetical protein